MSTTNVIVTHTSSGVTTATVTPQQSILVSSYRLNETTQIPTNLGDLIDVNITSPVDGSLLAYNSASQKWEAVTRIEKPSVEFNGGFF